MRAFLSDALSFFEEARGRPQFSLRDIRAMPDQELGALKPMILPGNEILVGDDAIRALKGRDEITLFARDPLEEALFNEFNGLRSIAEIARCVAAQVGCAYAEEAFPRARGLFLGLVGAGVCAPSNPQPETDEPNED